MYNMTDINIYQPIISNIRIQIEINNLYNLN